jgi:hypothetical protein
LANLGPSITGSLPSSAAALTAELHPQVRGALDVRK